ncbi:MAG: sulfatase/phosphatase domain-containing protein, partial [Bacteroidota bacterium]
LAYAGLPIPAEVQGQNLRPCVQEGKSLDREAFLCEHLYELAYIPKSEGIRTKRYKYFRYLDTSIEELYDLELDPMEIHNLADSTDHQTTKAYLIRRLDNLIQQASQ